MAPTVATIQHLKRLDLYKTVKPYMFAYDRPSGTGPNTNHSYEVHEIEIQDAQSDFSGFSLDLQGFSFAEWKTNLTSSDFDDNDVVKTRYYPEVFRHLKDISAPGTEFYVLRHIRRKRAPNFPRTRERAAETVLNPIIFAHVDFSSKGAEAAMSGILQANPRLQGRKFDFINVWRITKGPNKHWPLALCDFRTVDHSDIESCDVIHSDHIGESLRLYAKPEHKWYYLDNQTKDQVILFRNALSEDLDTPFAVHSSFARSGEDETQAGHRESIEVRVVRFFTQ